MAFGTAYQGDYVDDKGVSRRWQILEEGFSGTTNTSLIPSDRGFVSTSWSASDNDEYSPFIVSTSTIRLIDDASNSLYNDIIEALDTGQDRHFQLYLRDMTGGGFGTLDWRGYVRRGSITAPEDGPRILTIEADDGIGHLKDIMFASTSATVWGKAEDLPSGRVTYTELIQKLILRNSLGGDIYISCNQYPRLSGTQLDEFDNPMDNVYVEQGVYRTKEESTDGEKYFPIPSYDVLEDVLRTWGCTLFQHGGEWHVIQVNQRGNNSLRRWKYSGADATPVGTPNYANVTSHVVTVTDEEVKREPSRLTQLPPYDAAQVNFEFDKFEFMRNPGFSFEPTIDVFNPTTAFAEPNHWTLDFNGSTEYIDNEGGDGQVHTRIVQTNDADSIPTENTGTGADSIDAWVDKHTDPSTGGVGGHGLVRYADLSGTTGGTPSFIGLDGSQDYPIKAGETIWLVLDDGTYDDGTYKEGTYEEGTVTSNVDVNDTGADVSGITGVATDGNGVYVKATASFSQLSRVEIGSGERINVQGEFLPSFKNGTGLADTHSESAASVAFIQVVLYTNGPNYYLRKGSGSAGFVWGTANEKAWISHTFSSGDWNIINYVSNEDTPDAGRIEIRLGPALQYRKNSDTPFSVRRIRWDNVTVRPVIVSATKVNSAGKSVMAVADTQATEVAHPKQITVRVGDAPITPSDVGMSTSANGRGDTGNWTEGPVGVSASGVDHEELLAKMALRSMRVHREVQTATYPELGQAVTAWHVLSRGGSEYAPREVTQIWDRQIASGSWYKVTETGFTSSAFTIFKNAALVSSRGGVGPGTAGLFTAMGNAFFADGSSAITRTDATISAGVVTSISTEIITEPIFKADDLIAIVGPDLSWKQVRISADQDALATSLSIEDKDSPGTGVTFDDDVPPPAAIYFLEEELLTLARLGEQGFAVTVLGGALGAVNGAQSGTLSSITVDGWVANLSAGASVWVDEDTKVTAYGDVGLTRGMKRGDTTLYFGDPTAVTLADNQDILAEGTTRRSDFKVTADAITAFTGSPGGTIATVASAPTFTGGKTSIPVGTSLTDDLVAADTLLFYTASGAVIKATVDSALSAGASPIVLTTADGDQTGNISSGDKVTPGSVTGLRIDMDGISVTADTFKSTNYSAGSAGWAIFGDGSAEFSDITARGSITITAGSSGITNFSDAGDGVEWDTADDVIDGLSKSVTTNNEKTGAGRAYTGLNSAGSLVTSVIPATAVANPGSPGLFLGSDYMGYHDGSGTVAGWKTFMDSSGNFYLTGSPGSLSWTASTGVLAITGAITITGGSGIASLSDAGALAVLDAVDTAEIATGAVTETVIASDAITTPKIATDAVTTEKILAEAITAAKIDVTDLFAQTIAITGTGKMTIGTGLTPMAFGFDVNGTNDGLYIDGNNYWYDTGIFTVGDGSKSLAWNGTDVILTGQIKNTSGTVIYDPAGATGTGTLGGVNLTDLSLTGTLTVGGGTLTSTTSNMTLAQGTGTLFVTGQGVDIGAGAIFVNEDDDSVDISALTVSLASSGFGSSISIEGLTWPSADGTAGQFLKTDGAGSLSWDTASSGSTTLGGLSDVTITSAATGDILRYNGTAWVDYPDSNYAAAGHTHAIGDITGFTDNSTNWDTAYGWGNHATAGYASTGDNVSIFTNDAGYTTNIGDITHVTAGTGLSGGGASGSVALSLDLNELGGGIIATFAGISSVGASVVEAVGFIGLSRFNNDAGYTANAGTVTEVATGDGLSGGTITSSGTILLDLAGITTTTAEADLSFFAISTAGGNNRKIAPGNIGVSVFSDDGTYASAGAVVLKSTGLSTSVKVEYEFDDVAGSLFYRYKTLTLTNGQATSLSAFSSWFEVV